MAGKKVILIIDETGDKKKGNTTDYVARQYIGNLGKVENGIVSVNAYGVVGNTLFPLMFKGKDSGLKTCGSNACLARVLGQNKGFCLSWLIVNKGRKTVIFCALLRIEIYLASSSRSKVFAQQGVQ